MDVNTREEVVKPLGVIACLTAGFDVLSRNLWLIALPVLFDAFLWLGPRLSVAPIVQRFTALMMAQPAPDVATARQLTQAAQLIDLFGERFNVLSLCGTLPLLNVPSLLAQRAPGALSPLGESYVFLVERAFALMGWGALLIPVGLALGFLYLSQLARRIRVACSPEEQASGDAAGKPDVIQEGSPALRFLRVFLFGAALVMAGMVLVPLWMLLVGTALTLAPSLGLLAWAMSLGLGGYLALHLLFVIPGVVLGGRGLLRAIWESIVLIHTQFSAVIGLVVVVVVIYEGLGYVWSLPSADSWSLLVGILGNACVATGLTAATFVFYQERVPSGDGRPI
jgi:hypothetical protein